MTYEFTPAPVLWKRRQEAVTELRSLDEAAAGTPTAGQREQMAELEAEVRSIDAALPEAMARPMPGADGGDRAYGAMFNAPEAAEYGRPMEPGVSFRSLADARNVSVRPGDLGRFVAGLAKGNMPEEFRAQNEGTGSAGGFLVPTALSATIIDKARAASRVVEAGATTVPLSTMTTNVPVLIGDVVPQWRTEASAVPETSAVFDRATLTAKSLACLVKVSWEALDDAVGLEATLRDSIAAAFGLELDRAALFGSGVDPEPKGLYNVAGIPSLSMGANGAALTGWAPLVNAVATVRAANREPSAQIMATRTDAALALLADTTGQPLNAPAYLADVPRLATTQVPVNMTQGTSNVASVLFTGDWKYLWLGVRSALSVRVLSERYADTGQVGIIASMRADVAVLDKAAFVITKGVL